MVSAATAIAAPCSGAHECHLRTVFTDVPPTIAAPCSDARHLHLHPVLFPSGLSLYRADKRKGRARGVCHWLCRLVFKWARFGGGLRLYSGASFDYRLRQQTGNWREAQVHVNGALTTERISCGQKPRLCIGRGQKSALCIGAGQKSGLCIGPKITLQRLKMQTSL